MAVRPIDLQTMFMRMTELSREQAVAQEAVAHRQAAQDATLAKVGKEKEETVSQTEEVHEGPEKLGDQEEQTPQQRQRKRREESSGDHGSEAEVESAEPEKLTDPMLGRNIDISG